MNKSDLEKALDSHNRKEFKAYGRGLDRARWQIIAIVVAFSILGLLLYFMR